MNTLRNELKANYSQIPNELITDLTLSSGALRVLLYLFTKPDNWNVYNADICKQLDISEKTLTKYWNELLNSKWLRREQKRNNLGKLQGGYIYRIGIFTVSEESSVSEEISDHSNNIPIQKKETNKTNTKEIKQNETINNKGYSIEFEKAWDWYNENTTRPTGDKKKAYSSYLKQLKIIPHREINGAIYNYVMECKKSNTFTKHLVSFLNGDLEQYLNRNRNIKIETKPTYNYTEDGTMICKPEFKYVSDMI